MIRPALDLGIGVGWRPELALMIERRSDLGFIEVIAENIDPGRPLPAPIERLKERGIQVIPHGVTLSLGSAERPDPKRVEALASLAERLGAPVVSEHAAFVRARGMEAGHLLPLPRTNEALDILVENIGLVKKALPVPMAIENVASLFEWPNPEMDEATFLAEAAERADVLLLLDLSNLHANARNHGWDPLAFLSRLPLERLAYVHLAGGIERRGLYHDTHAHPIPDAAFSLLKVLCAEKKTPGVLLERDDRFPPAEELYAELDEIAAVMEKRTCRRRTN